MLNLRFRLLKTVTLLLLIATATLPARAQSLPPAMMTDEIVAVIRIDLEPLDPATMLTATKTALPSQRRALAPKLKQLELLRKKFLDAGIQSITSAAGMGEANGQPTEKTYWFYALKPGAQPPALGPAFIENFVFEKELDQFIAEQVSGGIAVYRKDQKPDFNATPGEQAGRLQAAIKSLGKRPGIVFVPSQKILQVANNQAAMVQAMLPPSVGKMIGHLQNLDSVSLAAKVDDAPAVKLTLQMKGDDQAKQLIDDLSAMSAELAQMLQNMPQPPPGLPGAEQPAGPMQLMGLLSDIKIKQKGPQAILTFDSQLIGKVVDLGYLGQQRQMMMQLGSTPDHPLENMTTLLAWISLYQQIHGELPNSLEDLKPLLADNAADRDADFKDLLTHPVTKESPGYVYKKPDGKFADLKDKAAQTIILQELKGGQPDPAGYDGYLDGHLSVAIQR